MVRWLSAAVILELVAVGAGCGLGGQSGTEGAMDDPCVCDGVGEATPFAGVVTAHEGELWTVRVDRLLSERIEPESYTEGPPEADEELTGEWRQGDGCGDGLEIRVGDTVLGLQHNPGYWEEPPCAERLECSEDRCQSIPNDGDPENIEAWARCDSECIEETRDVCAESTPPVWHEARFSLAARDADGWLFGERFGEPLHVADDEPELITDHPACFERFAHNACEGYDGPGGCG